MSLQPLEDKAVLVAEKELGILWGVQDMYDDVEAAAIKEAAKIFDCYAANPHAETAQDTAQKIADVAEALFSYYNPRPAEGDYAAAYIIYDHLLLRAQRTVHDDPFHDDAISILQALKSIPSDNINWSKSRYMGMQVCETWHTPVAEKYGVDGWISFNAFMARLNAHQIVPGGFDTYASRAMSVFEVGEIEEEEDLVIACIWILYNGERMRELCERKPVKSRAIYGGGSMWLGWAGYCMERWEFWKRELKRADEKGGFEASTQRLVSQALSCM